MKKTYLTPVITPICIEAEALIAGANSLSVNNNPHDGINGDSNRRGYDAGDGDSWDE